MGGCPARERPIQLGLPRDYGHGNPRPRSRSRLHINRSYKLDKEPRIKVTPFVRIPFLSFFPKLSILRIINKNILFYYFLHPFTVLNSNYNLNYFDLNYTILLSTAIISKTIFINIAVQYPSPSLFPALRIRIKNF